MITKSQNKKGLSNKDFIKGEDATYSHKKCMILSKIEV